MKKYLLPLVLAGGVFAQNSVSITKSTTNIKEDLWTKIKKNSSMTFFAQYWGPGLNNPSSSNTLGGDNTPEVGSPMNTWNQISYRYQLNKKVRVVFNGRFSQYFGQRLGDNNEVLPNTEGLNPVAGITIRHSFSDKFSYSGAINTIAANVQEGTQDDGLLANPGGFQTLAYKVTDKFSVGTWIAARANFYDNADSNRDLQRWSTWIAPFAEYSIGDTTYLRGFFAQDWRHKGGESLGTVVNRGNNVGLGVDFGINKYIGIYPYIEMSWADRTAAEDVVISTESASIGAWIYGSIF